MVALRMPARISSSVSASPSMNFSNRRSSNSDTASTSLSRYSLAFSSSSAGISTIVEFRPQRLVAPDHGLHRHQVHDALELVLGADRYLNRHGPRLQPLHNRLDRAVEIRAHAVHLVDEAQCAAPCICPPAATPSPTAAARRPRRRIPPPRHPARAGSAPPRP